MNKFANTAFVAALIATSGLSASSQTFAADNDPNRFNRLLPPVEQRTPPLAEDGIHDPANPGIKVLQQPSTAFKALDRGTAGNYVDWVKSLKDNKISPRYDMKDPKLVPMTVDMNIVREVKGSMPDVLFPHEAHTQWLDCANCHPAIFKPQKGANQMNMIDIMFGKTCGVCHGTVAFPVTECRRCHSKAKPLKKTAQKSTGKN